MNTRFLQLHFLTSYPASLLNRDDAGFAKRIPFGGVTRTRISSQCLKRHWRTFEGENSLKELEVPGSIRSRMTFERFVRDPLVEKDKVPADVAAAVTKALMDEVLGKSQAKKAAGEGEEKAPRKKGAKNDEGQQETSAPDLRTGQITVLGRPEVEYFLSIARAICREKPGPKEIPQLLKEKLGKTGKENLAQLRHAAGLDAALFGRMVTSDILARGDAALHVAHAFTVHEEETESDYFSAVDDLVAGGDDDSLGSGHIGSAELTSGLFYGYVAVDVPLLVSNLEGCPRAGWEKADRDLAGRVVERLVHLVATVSPGAKLGSTAPHAYAHFVLAEAGNAQPRSLANAFLRPVRPGGDLLGQTYAALGAHLADLDRMYGATTGRKFAALGPVERLAPGLDAAGNGSLGEVAAWAAARVRGGR
jgi:CRISPR system Cascade subunit CasC